MTHFTVSVDIQALPEKVWAVMKEVERWHEWTASIQSITPLNDGPFSVGKRFRVRQPKAPAADWQVTEVREGKSFTWISKAPGVQVTGHHEVEARGTGSLATLSIRYDGMLGALAALLTLPLNDRYLKLEAQGLKARSEK